MNLAAIHHEATQEYCFCMEPGKFLFRLQTGKNDLYSVTLHTRDKCLLHSMAECAGCVFCDNRRGRQWNVGFFYRRISA